MCLWHPEPISVCVWRLLLTLLLRFSVETLMLKKNIQLASLAAAALLALALAGCGGGEPQPTATPPATPTAAPTATSAATATPAAVTPAATTEATAEAGSAPVSPLTQPNSPLAPESPLAAPPNADLPPAVDANGRPLHDIDAIRKVAAANTPPAPQAGKASLSALLFSNSWGQVIPGNLIYLTPTIQDNGNEYPPSFFSGPDQAKGDIPFYSDEYGRISADNVTPGRYVLAVWTVYDYIIIEDPNNPGAARIFDIKPGDQIDLGLMELGWP